MKKYIPILLSSLAMVSCVDTVLLPDDKTVEEDYWQTKEQVAAMVNGAYSAMASENIQKRLIIWTSRSDELNFNSALTERNLNQIYSANIQTDNGYNSWGDFYAVINNCNLVIAKSEEVMSIDPNYLEGDHLNNIGQMKALRSLCYFYLIRAFHDVPLIIEPFKESSQDNEVPQVAPGVVLEQIISDLEEVKNYTLSTQNATTWQRMGKFTRNGVLALLADVYLWKGAIYNDEASYNRVIELANEIRDNRKNQFAATIGRNLIQLEDDGFALNPYYSYYDMFEGTGNDTESLFELQYTDNVGLINMYHSYKKNQTQPYYYTNTVYSTVGNADNYVYVSDKDVRGFESVFGFNGASDGDVPIRKYIGTSNVASYNGTLTAQQLIGRNYSPFDQNWIVYRTSDVILMKGEAMAEKAKMLVKANESLAEQLKGATGGDSKLQLANQLKAVNQELAKLEVTSARQVQIVNTRAYNDGTSLVDSTRYNVQSADYDGTNVDAYATSQVNAFESLKSSADALELLVMQERAREFCFEGKRWYDMLRYNYRHAVGFNYDQLLVNGATSVANYEEMLNLMARKYTSGGSAIKAKMQTEPYLYMPVLKSEIEVNKSLVQNPVYKDNSTAEKTY